MDIRLKRVYEPATPDDGARILVERLWPRGVSKERAALETWLRDIAPSPELRKWYGHRVELWQEFRKRYLEELREKENLADEILDAEKRSGTVTLVYAARDEAHNSAVVLRDFLRTRGGTAMK